METVLAYKPNTFIVLQKTAYSIPQLFCVQKSFAMSDLPVEELSVAEIQDYLVAHGFIMVVPANSLVLEELYEQ